MIGVPKRGSGADPSTSRANLSGRRDPDLVVRDARYPVDGFGAVAAATVGPVLTDTPEM